MNTPTQTTDKMNIEQLSAQLGLPVEDSNGSRRQWVKAGDELVEIPLWNPIETAPKDGTEIIAYGRGTDRCVWDDDHQMPLMTTVIRWRWHDGEREEDAGNGLFRKIPCRVLEGWHKGGFSWFTPTHWMPLPQPPAIPAPAAAPEPRA